MNPRIRHALVVIGLSIGLSILLTWPAVAHMGGVVLGSSDADTMKHLWTLWWMRRTLAYDQVLAMHTSYINFPMGLDLWPIEPLNGMVAALLWPLPLVATANLLAILNLSLDGICGALLGQELTGSRRAGLVAGLLLQSSAFALFTISVGVGELQHLWFLPLGFWFLLRLVKTWSWTWAVALGACLIVATLSCFYHGFFLAMGLLVLGGWALARAPRRWKALGCLAVAALLAALVVLPVTRVFRASYGGEAAPRVSLATWVTEPGHGQPDTDPPSSRLQLMDLLGKPIPADAPRELRAYGGGRLLGIPALMLVVLVLVRRPKEAIPWIALAATGILFALGSFLSFGGHEIQVGGNHLGMPFFYLNRVLAFYGEPINFPVRFLALTHVAVAAMGALAVGVLPGRGRPVVLLLCLANVVDVQVRDNPGWPLPSFSIPDYSWLSPLAGHSSHGVLDLTMAWRADQETRFQAMAAQFVHQHPIQPVPIERLEFFVRGGTRLGASLKMVEDLEPGWLRQPIVVERDYRGDLLVLREAGFEEILVTSQGAREPLPVPLTLSLERFLGAPILSADNGAIYRIPEVAATPEEMEAFRAEHRVRLADAERADQRPGASLR